MYRLRIFRFDEWGTPEAGDGAALTPENGARFLYTGQVWMRELGLYHYKARMYSPLLGRFMQTDPVGYADQMNLHAYVGNDPVNAVDPTGLKAVWVCDGDGKRCRFTDDDSGESDPGGDITVDAPPPPPPPNASFLITVTAQVGRTGEREKRQNDEPNREPVTLDFCGSGATAGLIPDAFPRDCRIHDTCYGTVENTKEQCDTNFKYNMLDTCRSRGSGPICVSTAFIYWRAVVTFGGQPYRDAQEEARRRLRGGR